MTLVAVIGGGAWGTALAVSAARANPASTVFLVVRDGALRTEINDNRTNKKYAGATAIPANVVATLELGQEFGGAAGGVVIIAVPTRHAHTACCALSGNLTSKNIVVLAAKGMEPSSDPHSPPLLMSQVAKGALGTTDAPVLAISGPSFADGVLCGEPTIVTLGGPLWACTQVANLLKSNNFAVETTEDIVGVQVCGAFKNIVGIAFGMAIGAGLGHNAKARLFVQAMQEMRSLCIAMGGSANTAMHACGIGDMFLSCESMTSRNTKFGYALAQGSASSITAKPAAKPEGYYMAQAIRATAERLSLPICTGVCRVLFEQEGCERALRAMLTATHAVMS